MQEPVSLIQPNKKYLMKALNILYYLAQSIHKQTYFNKKKL